MEMVVEPNSIAVSMRPRVATIVLPAAVIAAVAIYPAIWNGFPLVFSDTSAYLGSPGFPGVPPFYGVFVAISSLRISLFLTVIVQAAIMASVIVTFLFHIGEVRKPSSLLVFGLAVVLLNQVPWLVSWVMPDIFAGVGIAAMSVLLFRQDELELYEYAALLGVVLLSALSATANLPFYVGFLGFSVASRWILVDRKAAMTGSLMIAFALIMIATLAVSANLIIHGRAELNSASPTLNFSRLADIGLAQPVVREVCRGEQFAVCDHLDALDENVRGEQSFLWGGIADETNSRTVTRAEYATLVSRIIRERWPAFLDEGLKDAGRLFVSPALSEFASYPVDTWTAHWIKTLYPTSLEAYLEARQQQGEVLTAFPGTVYAVSTFVSYGILVLVTAIAWRRNDRMAVALGLAGLAAVVGHLVLHGVLVGPFPRYHAKIGWIGWLFVAVILARAKADLECKFPVWWRR